MVLSKSCEALRLEVRRMLAEGGRITIVGWMTKNHNDFTEKLSRSKVVTFLHPDFHSIPKSARLVIFTTWISHSNSNRIRGRFNTFPGSVETGIIKDILGSCRDILERSPGKPPSVTLTRGGEEPSTIPDFTIEDDEKLLDFRTTPTRRHEMDEMDRFAEAFKKEADKDPEGKVRSFILVKLMEMLGPRNENGVRRLVKTGMLVPVTVPGKSKASMYIAGPAMIEILTSDKLEPDDPLERAKWLIAQAPAILAEKVKLEDELSRTNVEFNKKIAVLQGKLNRINEANELLGKLEELMKPKA